MRRCFLLVSAAASLIIANPVSSFAQKHEIPALNSCIKEFYDPGMYNYLTFKNTCLQSLTIVFVPKNGAGPSGTMDLRPGASDSVGRSAAGVVPKIGTLQLYVCPVGNMPLDEDNKVVTKAGASVQCKAKPQ